VINVYPKYISVKYWAATVCSDYSDQGLPILLNEDKWGQWAKAVISYEPFQKAGVPSPYNQKKQITENNKKSKEVLQYNWETWAKMAYNIMNAQPVITEKKK
jgi:hypothetical protein